MQSYFLLYVQIFLICTIDRNILFRAFRCLKNQALPRETFNQAQLTKYVCKIFQFRVTYFLYFKSMRMYQLSPSL